MKKILCALLVTFVAVAAHAGDEMKKLDWLAGEWKGEGWFQRGPGPRSYVLQNEKVTPRIGGRAQRERKKKKEPCRPGGKRKGRGVLPARPRTALVCPAKRKSHATHRREGPAGRGPRQEQARKQCGRRRRPP